MPRVIRSFGDTAQDREIDYLHKRIDDLLAQLNKASGPAVTPPRLYPAPNSITVQDETGDPVRTVSGLQFLAADATISEENGIALLDLSGAGGVSVEVSGASPVGPESLLNFIPGTNIDAISAVDSGGQIDITIDAADPSGVEVKPDGGSAVGPKSILNFIAGTHIDAIAAVVSGSQIDITIDAEDQSGGGGSGFWGSTNSYEVGTGISASLGLINVIMSIAGNSPDSGILPALILALGATPKMYIQIYTNNSGTTMTLTPNNTGTESIGGSSSSSLPSGSKALLVGMAGPVGAVTGRWERVV